MAEMHRGFEEEIREEEARMLALELEKTELLENEETRDACERHERWIASRDEDGDEGTKFVPNEEVLCPVCLESRLLQTRVWRVYSRRTARTDVTARSCSP